VDWKKWWENRGVRRWGNINYVLKEMCCEEGMLWTEVSQVRVQLVAFIVVMMMMMMMKNIRTLQEEICWMAYCIAYWST